MSIKVQCGFLGSMKVHSCLSTKLWDSSSWGTADDPVLSISFFHHELSPLK